MSFRSGGNVFLTHRNATRKTNWLNMDRPVNGNGQPKKSHPNFEFTVGCETFYRFMFRNSVSILLLDLCFSVLNTSFHLTSQTIDAVPSFKTFLFFCDYYFNFTFCHSLGENFRLFVDPGEMGKCHSFVLFRDSSQVFTMSSGWIDLTKNRAYQTNWNRRKFRCRRITKSIGISLVR